MASIDFIVRLFVDILRIRAREIIRTVDDEQFILLNSTR